MLLDDGKGKAEPTKQLAFRLPKSLADYIIKRAGDKRGAPTRMVEKAIALHKYLYEKAMPHKPRLQRFALDKGLDWDTQEDEVYVQALLLGLDAHEKKQK